jgi:RNA polymerase sigma-70 factor (ECF subfamily)
MLAATALGRNDSTADWLERFHAGDVSVLEAVYADCFAHVAAAIAPLLDAVDREAIIHDVFASLLERADMRASFHGGSIAAWLAQVARNRAIDLLRRRGREARVLAELGAEMRDASADPSVGVEARRALVAFRAELPDAWRGVFDACFVRQISQREAAKELAIARTTIAYRAIQIRRRLRRFILEGRDV